MTGEGLGRQGRIWRGQGAPTVFHEKKPSGGRQFRKMCYTRHVSAGFPAAKGSLRTLEREPIFIGIHPYSLAAFRFLLVSLASTGGLVPLVPLEFPLVFTGVLGFRRVWFPVSSVTCPEYPEPN